MPSNAEHVHRKPAPAPYRPTSSSLPPTSQASPKPSSASPHQQSPPTPSKLQKAEPPRSVPSGPPEPSSPRSSLPQKLQKESPGHSKPLPKVRSNGVSPHGSPVLQPRVRGNSLVAPPVFSDVAGRVVSSPASSRPISGYQSEGEHTSGHKLKKSWLGGKSRSSSGDSIIQGSTAWVISGEQKLDYSLTPLTQGEKVPELWDENADTLVYLFPRANGHGPSFKIPSITLSSSQPLVNLVHGDIYSGRTRAKSFDGRGSLAAEDATRNLAVRGPGTPPYTSSNPNDNASNSDGSADTVWSGPDGPREIHLDFPITLSVNTPKGNGLTQQDVQTLVDVRNLFAFLTSQPLVATPKCNSVYLIFLAISNLLKQFEFTNFDNSTHGEAASASFSFYQEQLRLGDVAHSREKTLEALVLGERMRSIELYNEAFAHAAGRYFALQEMKSPLYDQIAPTTRNRLERAAMDLRSRQAAVNDRLVDFEFPSLFSGIAASTSRPEAKHVDWRAWKLSFFSFRKALMSYYKHLYGSWPPKASSKKNQFTESGLNRLVLKGLYRDLSSLYDLLANREAITTRHYDTAADETEETNVDPLATALRLVLSEYDRSSPPVKPPIPFDIPKVPTMATVDPTYPLLAPKDQHKLSTRRLKSHETLLILAKSHNMDSDYKTPFLEMFRNFEEKEAKGKSAQELMDQRYGCWLFMYVVIQALPMLAVDVPGLHYTQGVEYFLCEPPLGNAPWIEDRSNVNMAWYGVQGGAGVVSLPSDVVIHGVEGVYRRSHCWTIAEKWLSTSPSDDLAAPAAIGSTPADVYSPLEPPPGFAGGYGSRPSSRGRDSISGSVRSSPGLSPHDYSGDERGGRSRQSQRSSIALGLEQLPIPVGGSDDFVRPMSSGGRSRNASPAQGWRVPSEGPGSRPVSRGAESTATKTGGSTFDDILMSMDNGKEKKKKRKSIAF